MKLFKNEFSLNNAQNIQQASTENQDHNRNENRERMIVWFNFSYSFNVANNICKKFLLLFDKHFPQAYQLSKVLTKMM